MDEVAWFQEIWENLPHAAVIAFLAYRVAMAAIKAYKEKQLQRNGIRTRDNNGNKKPLRELIVGGLATIASKQAHIEKHFDERLLQLEKEHAECIEKIGKTIHDQIDDQTTVLAGKQDEGNKLLAGIEGAITALTTVVSSRR